MPNDVRLLARAKVNLRLRVLGRETSGYHAVETLFHRIELADDVSVRVAGSARSIDCRGADVGPAERNLAFRAAIAYADATGWPHGFAIEIEKRIPAGGGLGGGSADAGAVLRALDSLSPRPLGARLTELAIALGSDVPFLTLDAPFALAWGHGERMLALEPLPSRPVVVLFPDFRVATADAYGWLSADRGEYQRGAVAIDLEDLSSWERVAELARNDFDAPVRSRHPEVSGYLEALRSGGAMIAMVAGSGSSVFGLFDQESEAAAALGAASVAGLVTYTVSGAS